MAKTKRKLPMISDIPSDFFSDDAAALVSNISSKATLLDQIQSDAEEITTPVETTPLKAVAKAPKEGKAKEKKKNKTKLADRVGEGSENDTSMTGDFIKLLQESKDRRNTKPVRIKMSNYEKILELRTMSGGTRSVPELVDWILEMYLKLVDEQLNSTEH